MKEELRKRVLEKITPKPEEVQFTEKIADELIKKIKKEGYEAELVGSRARGTFISGDRDLDIFIFFDPKTPLEELEKKGLEIGKKVLKKYGPVTHYAQHPYVKAKVKGITVEIVPCYKIKTQIISAVDRTPLHNKYLKKKLKKEHIPEILLLKQFLKAAGLYGADQKTKGFSGYLCELLILYYGSFDKLIEKAANEWNKRIIIDIENLRKDYSKFKEPLVVIDPVDKERNVASAVSRKAISLFIIKARQFLERPSEEFFFPKEKKINLKEEIRGRNLILISFKPPNVVGEILWSQLEKLAKMIKEKLYEQEFHVYKFSYWTDEEKKCGMVFELNTLSLNHYKRHRGPEVWDKENSKAFIEKNKKWWVMRSRLYAWKKRKHPEAKELIKEALNSEQVPSHLKQPVKKAVILTNEKTLKEKEILRRYFEV